MVWHVLWLVVAVEGEESGPINSQNSDKYSPALLTTMATLIHSHCRISGPYYLVSRNNFVQNTGSARVSG